MTGRDQRQDNQSSAKQARGKGRKAVLNVTVSEDLADRVRELAALGNTTISSVVERALAEQVSWEIKRMQGLAAIDLIYREEGYPTAEERAEATARVVEEERLADEAAAANAAKGWKPPWLTAQWPGDSGSGLGAA